MKVCVDRSHLFDHVVIFDEAQRAWNRDKTADFMKRRKKIPEFKSSEPEFLISYLDRHRDWAVIICLGQEIHTGEAGIGEWLEVLRLPFPYWPHRVEPTAIETDICTVDCGYAAFRAHRR